MSLLSNAFGTYAGLNTKEHINEGTNEQTTNGKGLKDGGKEAGCGE